MSKYKFISVALFILGILFLCIAGYSYWSILHLRETFDYYGIKEKDYILDKNIAETFSNLNFGIIKFSILSIIALVSGTTLLFKKGRK